MITNKGRLYLALLARREIRQEFQHEALRQLERERLYQLWFNGLRVGL